MLEVLAFARKDKYLAEDLDEIVEEQEDTERYPTQKPGTLDKGWMEPRLVAKAVLQGRYCHITAAETIAELRPHFVGPALAEGHQDFDAALLKNGAARTITQLVSAHMYVQEGIDGISFSSRHGDDLRLWCVFEQSDDGPISHRLMRVTEMDLHPDMPEMLEAFRLFELKWAD